MTGSCQKRVNTEKTSTLFDILEKMSLYKTQRELARLSDGEVARETYTLVTNIDRRLENVEASSMTTQVRLGASIFTTLIVLFLIELAKANAAPNDVSSEKYCICI